jgi:hypothetical protein
VLDRILKDGMSVERVLESLAREYLQPLSGLCRQRYRVYRYFDWSLKDGCLEFSESQTHLGRAKKIEGKYVIATSGKGLSVLEAVAMYKEFTQLESEFRQLEDVMAMRPIYRQVESRVKAHILVAALALLVQRLLGRRLKEAGVDLSLSRAMEALSTARLVTFQLEGQAARKGAAGGCPEVRLVLKALNLINRRPPAPPEGEESAM